MSSEAMNSHEPLLIGASSLGGPSDRIYQAIAGTSKYLAFVSLLVMMAVMVAEVAMRYFLNEPLGWNISLIEKILLPGLVFLGLPWAYTVGAHVAAELVYDRLPGSVQLALDWVARALLLLCAMALAYGGWLAAAEAFSLGSVPPPLSSQVPVSTWIWRSFMPIGASMMVVLLIIDTFRNRTRVMRES